MPEIQEVSLLEELKELILKVKHMEQVQNHREMANTQRSEELDAREGKLNSEKQGFDDRVAQIAPIENLHEHRTETNRLSAQVSEGLLKLQADQESFRVYKDEQTSILDQRKLALDAGEKQLAIDQKKLEEKVKTAVEDVLKNMGK